MKTILILGGYGNFGKRIVESLSVLPDITLYISGRDIAKAELLREKLKNQSLANLETLMIDINSAEFETILNVLSPDIVIHTSGPFQGQDYHVPLACIDAGAHYIDLADDRRFVCDIKSLDDKAKGKNLLIVSGASSVPGLSSTVIDFYKDDFSSILSIDIAIAPGNKAERGMPGKLESVVGRIPTEHLDVRKRVGGRVVTDNLVNSDDAPAVLSVG